MLRHPLCRRRTLTRLTVKDLTDAAIDADGIRDRLVHNAHRIEMRGETPMPTRPRRVIWLEQEPFGYWEPVIRAAKEYWLSALQKEVWLTPTRNQLHRVSHDLCPPGPISPGGNQRLRLAKLSARTSSVERAK